MQTAVSCVSGRLSQQCWQHELSRTNRKYYLFIDIYKNAWYTLKGGVALSSLCVREGRPGQKDLFLLDVWVLLSHSFLTSLSASLPLPVQSKSSSHRFPKLWSVSPTAIKGDGDSVDNYTFVLRKWLIGWSSGKTSIGEGWMLSRMPQGSRPLSARCCSAESSLGMCQLDLFKVQIAGAWLGAHLVWAAAGPAPHVNQQLLMGRRGNCLSNSVLECVKWQPTKNLSAW